MLCATFPEFMQTHPQPFV